MSDCSNAGQPFPEAHGEEYIFEPQGDYNTREKKIHYKIQFIHYNQGQPLVFPVSTNSWLKRAFLGGLAFSDGRSALQIEEPAWTASN
jgi:hypothetical protein